MDILGRPRAASKAKSRPKGVSRRDLRRFVRVAATAGGAATTGRDDLIFGFLGLAYRMAGGYLRTLGDDAYGEARLALVKAAADWPGSSARAKGLAFDLFARQRVRCGLSTAYRSARRKGFAAPLGDGASGVSDRRLGPRDEAIFREGLRRAGRTPAPVADGRESA